MKPAAFLLAPALLAPPVAAQDAPPAPAEPPAATSADEKVVNLEPFRVKGNAVGNFAITVQVFIREDNGKMQLIISKVLPDSDAERAGLQEGDEIVKIGGLLVADMEPDVGKDSALGRLLLNRKSGDILDLEVVNRRPRPVRLRASSWTGVMLTRPEPKVEIPVPEKPDTLNPGK